jgi:ABC-type nitrate/sulfonate/bicarbonate transport system permease component
MAESSPTPAPQSPPPPAAPAAAPRSPAMAPSPGGRPEHLRARSLANAWKLRRELSVPGRIVAGTLFMVLFFGVWTLLTRGKPEARFLSPAVMPSPEEIARSFHSLWFDRALTRSVLASLGRVLQGFGLAALIGVPVGVLCGTWPPINGFFAPLSVFGRNVPISALLPLTLAWFGIDELQKVMFIFVSCVMFVVFDSARSVASVDERYVHTALTLGAKPWQVLFKVLVPLALPDIFGSLRLLFGLAFGYIILAEMINSETGVGALILTSQRVGPKEHIYLVLVAITLVAWGIDRVLLQVQGWLFPYRSEER